MIIKPHDILLFTARRQLKKKFILFNVKIKPFWRMIASIIKQNPNYETTRNRRLDRHR